jgi:hypothetical protein
LECLCIQCISRFHAATENPATAGLDVMAASASRAPKWSA